jgi:hypothetical protein
VINALIDFGSELSFINTKTASYAQSLGFVTEHQASTVRMADDSAIEIPGTVNLPIEIEGKKYLHEFLIMPSLKSALLIGVDLWAKLGITLKPPPRSRPSNVASTTKITSEGLNTQTPEEQQKLKEFLERELKKFEKVQGPTDRAQHRIRLKTDQPIKQRYRPRNPAMQAVIDQEVEKMINDGIIEPSRSA